MRVSARGLSWLVVAAGLFAGWNAAPSRRADPPRYGTEVILEADFHVHSFPGDGSLAPWDLAVEANRRGLDAIALTNHNHRLSWLLAQWLPLPVDGALLIPGEELTSVRYHMAAVGSGENVSWRQDAASAARAIHAQGGVAIAAHPAGKDADAFDDAAIDVIDGVEAAHPLAYVVADGRRDLTAFYQRAKARRPAIAAIGSTDFHFFAPVGFCRTFVFASARSASAIVDAIRRGRTVACDASGQTFGPSDLSSVVADACRAAAGAPARDLSWADTASASLLWLGLLALIVVGASEPDLE